MSELDCIIQIVGGLGNQLFQYALGRRLEIDRKANVRFDLSMYRVKTDRDLTIRQFRTHVPDVSAWDKATMRISFGRTLGRCASLLKPLKNQLLWQIHEDPRKGFDSQVMDLHGRWYLRGWWQTPAYFNTLRPILLDEFQPAQPLSPPVQNLKHQIESVNAVCLHVRRGDLVTNPHYAKQLKVQSAGYYNTCLGELTEELDRPHVFVFSDDPDWTKANIRSQAPTTFMDQKGDQPPRSDYIDMHLMSCCKHFITANSTFSWWAAWLAKNPGKKVIVPPVWGYDGSGPPKGIVPEGWQIGSQLELSSSAL